MNLDGATFMKGQKPGIGVIARGSADEWLAWLAQRVLKKGDGRGDGYS